MLAGLSLEFRVGVFYSGHTTPCERAPASEVVGFPWATHPRPMTAADHPSPSDPVCGSAPHLQPGQPCGNGVARESGHLWLHSTPALCSGTLAFSLAQNSAPEVAFARQGEDT